MDKNKTNTNIEDSIIKEFGNDILSSGQSIIDSSSKVIPVSPGLDIILGGGIPEGSNVIITGRPKLGKTATSLHFAASAQQTTCDIGRKNGRHVYYFSIEGRLKKRDLLGIKGLQLDENRLTIIKSKPGKILTGENYINIAEKLIHEKPGDIFIIDSFSALCTEGEMKADMGERYRADAPRLLAMFCRRISNVVPINKSIVIGITHIIANQGIGMATWIEASGQKIQYQADVKLKATHCTPWLVGDTKIGQDIHWVCETSGLDSPPGGKFISKFRYGYGLDNEAEVINLAVDLGLIKKGGAWFTLPDDTKYQGLEKVRIALLENIKMYNELYNKIKTMMGLK